MKRVMIAAVACLSSASICLAQDAGGHRLESLDELLGLAPPGSPTDDGPRALPDPLRQELDRELSQEQAAEAFEQAAQLMDQTAARLGDRGDTGLTTQRLQEDILRKLDAVIDAAKQNQNQNQQSQSRPESQNQQQASQPQSQQQNAQNSQGDNTDEIMPPNRQDGPLRPEIDSARAAWGALPERVRDSLMQGLSDRYSSLYDALTREYYRRLAEEKKP